MTAGNGSAGGGSGGAPDAAAKYKFVRFEARLVDEAAATSSPHHDGTAVLGQVCVCRRDELIVSGLVPSSTASLTTTANTFGGTTVATTHCLIRVHMNHRSH
jgi:hypothetical protein